MELDAIILNPHDPTPCRAIAAARMAAWQEQHPEEVQRMVRAVAWAHQPNDGPVANSAGILEVRDDR